MPFQKLDISPVGLVGDIEDVADKGDQADQPFKQDMEKYERDHAPEVRGKMIDQKNFSNT